MTYKNTALFIGLFVALGFIGCNSNCDSLVFQPPEESAYILPYPAGQICELSLTYCSPRGHRNRLAYDIKMDIGQVVTTSRPGTVIEIKNNFSDSDHKPGHNNRVVIKHDDGSLAWYAHLQQHSVIINMGESLNYGDTLARCGQSGRSGKIPHLHFEVFSSRLYDYSDAIPITFSNIENPPDHKKALPIGVPFKALTY